MKQLFLTQLMPHKPSQYDFDYCPTCQSNVGTPVLKHWVRTTNYSKSVTIYDEQHNPVGTETSYEEKYDINQTRSIMGLPPLGPFDLTRITELNDEVCNNILGTARRWDALAAIFPLLYRKCSKIFEHFDIPKLTQVYCKLLKPIIDRRTQRGPSWSGWFDIGYWAHKQGYNAASKKAAVKTWDGQKHPVSLTQIKRKLPEVDEFAHDVIEYIPKFMDFCADIYQALYANIEIHKLFYDCWSWLRHDSVYMRDITSKSDSHFHSKTYEYYYIHHSLEKGRRTCGPFKKFEIPGLRLKNQQPEEFEKAIEGFKNIRDCYIEFVKQYKRYPSVDIESSQKYCEVSKRTFLA